MGDLNNSTEILIVEDSPTQAEHLKYILEKHGYKAAVAKNGKEAIDYLNTNLPSIIISDVVMPEMDGFELCKRVKSDEKLGKIPFVILTTLSDSEDVVRGLECGADNFMIKPFREESLIERLHYILLNVEIRKNATIDIGIEIAFAGRKHYITSSRIQMLNLLLSTYENAVLKTRELEKTNRELKEANEKIKTLGGLISICAKCKKIRDDKGYWHPLEAYLREYSGAEFTHGFCPDCLEGISAKK